VLSLLLILLVLWLVVTVALAAWTLWIQGYLYNEPTGEMYWRAPAAGAGVLVALAIWVWSDYRAPGRYQVFWYGGESSERQAPYPEIRTVNVDGNEEVYHFSKGARGEGQYRTKGGKPLTARPPQIIVHEGDEKVVYEPDRDANGNFKPSDDGYVYYRDPKDRTLVEGQFYYRSTPRRSWMLVGFVLHALLLIAWFLGLWLLLHFQWAHALGQAAVLWVLMLMFVMPPLLSRAEEVARQRAAPKAQA
jgi:hypothetical protein